MIGKGRPYLFNKMGRLLVLAWFMLGMVAPFAQWTKVAAVGSFVQSNTGTTNNGTSVNTSFAAPATAGNLLVVVCGGANAATLSVSGYATAAAPVSGTPSQGIFYKVATGGETSATCSSTSRMRLGIHIYEYSGMLTTSPLDGSGTANGTGTAVSSGSVTPTTANSLIFAAYTASTGTTYTVTGTGVTERNDFDNTIHYGASDNFVSTLGTYSIAATNSTNTTWRGQVVAFKVFVGQLAADIVNASDVPVSSPSLAFTAASLGFNCQTVTGTLGVSAQQLKVQNTTASPGWQLSIAATAGPTALWATPGTDRYDFNDPTAAGCTDGGDADSYAGQLTVDPGTGTLSPSAGCSNTGVTLGSATAFSQGVTDSAVIATGGATASTNCSWNITGVSLSQKIPAEQNNGTYTLGLTLTLIAQ